MRIRFSCLLFALGTLVSLQACTAKETEPTPDPTSELKFTTSTDKMVIKIDTLYTGFQNPWGMTWISENRMLVTEKKGEILIFKDDKFTGQKVTGLPSVYNNGQAGLLDITVHPNYAQNGWIYIAYAKPVNNGGATTIARFKLNGNAIADFQELIVTTPVWNGGTHYGSRIVFDNQNFLYFSNGERGSQDNAQDLKNSHGKIHRIHDDGRIPTDNPFVNTSGAVPSIWTYGNRNPQGLYFDKANNRLWEVEHGPRGGDELNILEKGKNYGWPVITYGINYNGTPITNITEKEGMEQPVKYWTPSIATCGMTMVTSDKYPAWRGNILVAALAGTHIARVEMNGTRATGEEKLLQGIGRVRQVSQSPDGYIYAVTEGTGLLIKILPGA
ncbi:glucose/arabinose dehydrogenase [Algoriphagus aquaeductus]|uniref:Glucose/arabinose dehydrogenase n=1 Tax=Algoriphagus aquaeductus TaxID=475299 RepID=A0A326RQA3_9BACT|nr:PQQ-dependent sugar dehydrogenase [Algoriphagus aquaeductus]PZV82989.1 glucose/arabinose dehydrogenase [Algoriphagus aquaeductus]